jgi:nucleotide-binding universal stress UspA family protein
MYKKILIALDGSAPSFRAVEAAHKMSECIEEISLIYVIHTPHVVSPDGQNMDFMPSQYYKELTRAAQQILDDAEQILGTHPNIRKIIESGLPAETILHMAEKEHYDLIIVGRRGLNSLQRLFLGSVSTQIVSLAPCAVMLIK